MVTLAKSKCVPDVLTQFSTCLTRDAASGTFFSAGELLPTNVCEPGQEIMPSSDASGFSCQACQPGRASAENGNRCSDCAAGKFANNEGLSKCADCSSGRFAAGQMSLSCEACEEGRYQDQKVIIKGTSEKPPILHTLSLWKKQKSDVYR